MLERFRIIGGYLPLEGGTAFTTVTDPALDVMLQQQIDAWYHRLLAEGAYIMLVPVDIKADIKPVYIDDGMRVDLPERVVRPLRIRLKGWHRDADILPSGHPAEALQLDLLTRATPANPVAILSPSGRSVMLYPATANPVFDLFETAAYTSDSLYHFHPAAIPDKLPTPNS